MALTDRNFYSMLSEDGTGSYYGPTVFFTGDYGGGGSLFETPTFSYPTIVNPQPTFDYGDLTGDLEQVTFCAFATARFRGRGFSSSGFFFNIYTGLN